MSYITGLGSPVGRITALQMLIRHATIITTNLSKVFMFMTVRDCESLAVFFLATDVKNISGFLFV